jgi:hypothetical protein
LRRFIWYHWYFVKVLLLSVKLPSCELSNLLQIIASCDFNCPLVITTVLSTNIWYSQHFVSVLVISQVLIPGPCNCYKLQPPQF